MSDKTQPIHEGRDADDAKGGQGLAPTDEAEETAADTADELQEGQDAEQATERLRQGNGLSRKP